MRSIHFGLAVSGYNEGECLSKVNCEDSSLCGWGCILYGSQSPERHCSVSICDQALRAEIALNMHQRQQGAEMSERENEVH